MPRALPRPTRLALAGLVAGLFAVAVQAQTPPPADSPLSDATLLVQSALAMPDAQPAPAGGRYTLRQLVELARGANPGLIAERTRIDAALADVTTARAFPNPQIEALTGQQTARMADSAAGRSNSYSLTQPLEYPSQRGARIGSAEAALDSSRAGVGAITIDYVALVKLRYYDVLRRDAELRNAREDFALADQIRQRVEVRVKTGESPKYEQIRAEAEWLNALRATQAATLRVQQAKAELRRAVGPALPMEFELEGDIDTPLAASGDATPLAAAEPPPLDAMRARLLDGHPQLVALRAAVRAAESQVDYQRSLRLPGLSLRGTVARTPDIGTNQLGVAVTIPLFDRRDGPIAAAQSDLARSRAALAARELELDQALQVAWQQWRIASGQVSAYEAGIVRQAESALRVAEAAYRYGERGILEYLDAQRAYRLARNELSAARYDLRAALVELERLQARSE
ncbi:TolC family protein [Derxia gummosa]|uniref:TolC family protein n=1 Tax=Derxia gummosa DSM 723 TaxID=1121388 RepID=A0A9U5CEC1_9BURK|nr:TolC family protein [Derxia gummosa]